MQYMGGKVRVAKRIAPLIIDAIRRTGATTYWEPFLGGANMFTRVAPHVACAIGSDVMPDLIMMWQAVQRGWTPPDYMTREEYKALRHAEPSALRAFAGFGCSFGGKWFGGYGAQKLDPKHPTGHVSHGSAATVRGQAPAMARARVELLDYRNGAPRPGWVVYCDPPYGGTTAYQGVRETFDTAEFWNTCRAWAGTGVHVYVSEYNAPDYAAEVWSSTTKGSLTAAENGRTVLERLFYLGPPID